MEKKMSYDLELGIKPEGHNKIVCIARPELDSPTWNLGEIFRLAMHWNFEIRKWYKLSDVYINIAEGIADLKFQPGRYNHLEPENGWGDIQGAIEALESLMKKIEELVEDEIPIEVLWLRW